MKKTLWSHDFIIITLGTLISAIGSTAMSFALSLVVFDHTSSTLMTGIFTAISLMPTVLIPILAAPLVDGCCRKRLIAMLDSGNGILYLLFAAFLLMQEFSYAGYLIFSLLTASFGAIYSLAYSSLYPDLIPKGFAQKGYSVSSLIYPSVTALFTPVASLLYVHLGIAWICAMEGILLLTAWLSLFEKRKGYPFHLRLHGGNQCFGRGDQSGNHGDVSIISHSHNDDVCVSDNSGYHWTHGWRSDALRPAYSGEETLPGCCQCLCGL